jgi:phosphate transport system protein
MRTRFDEQLGQLNNELIIMGDLCEEAINNVVSALVEDEETRLKKVFKIETKIDAQEQNIESLCMKLLLQQQPVARDLRTISSALKMISDMERIGDQACDIAELVKYINHNKSAKTNNLHAMKHIEEMSNATINMVTDSVDSFVKHDLEMAKKVLLEDDVVDNLFCEVKQDLIEIMVRDKTTSEFCLDLLMIAKYLERIGDHATNIAEWVIYSITGEHKNFDEFEE